MDRFTADILKFIRENALISRGDAVTAGFSGGADSTCLLLVLHELKNVLGIRLQAVHVNHHLRGEEADRDEAFCREFAAGIGVPFAAEDADVRGFAETEGLTEEEAGRILRYRALQSRAAAFAANAPAGEDTALVAVAHHADDQAETVLLNLLRGSGLKGLAGMKVRRDNIIRPLLQTSREEILAWLQAKGAAYVTDSTNDENDHTRNRLRNIVIPELQKSVNRRAAEHIAFSAGLIGEADEYLAAEAARFADSLPPVRYVSGPGGDSGPGYSVLALNQILLKEKAQILRRYVIIEVLRRLDVPLKDWGGKHLKDIDKALYCPKGHHVDLPGSVYAENGYRETYIFAQRKESYNGSGDRK